jgi:LPS-assembly protein
MPAAAPAVVPPPRPEVEAAKPLAAPAQLNSPRVPPAARIGAAQQGVKKIPHDPNARAPIYISADNLSGTTDQAIVAEGNVEIQQGEAMLTADKVTYWQLDEETEAEGNVRLAQAGAVVSGPKMRMRIEDSEGYFDQPTYVVQRQDKISPRQRLIDKPLHPDMPDITAPQQVTTTGSGTAERIDFEGEGQYRLKNASYSTCPAGDNQDWYAQVANLSLDYDGEVASGQGAKIVFQGVPILYAPSMSFPLNNQRKTGLLPATFGANSKVGIQYLQPYYWNIAPNMDATLYSRLMSKRGLLLGGETRYLDYNYRGRARFEYMPEDSNLGKSRGAMSVMHAQDFGAGLTGLLNVNEVSDDTYFSDLSNRIAVVSQGNLQRQGKLNYDAGWWSAGLNLQRYQTLQDPNQPPVSIPYARLPQVTLTASRPDLGNNLAFNLQGEYVKFSHPTATVGQRALIYPQLSMPINTNYFYVTPKVGVHATTYNLQGQPAGTPDSIARTLPIFSVDSAVTFERDTQWQGKSLTQTLEPRLYYLYVPNRKQDNIPVFDTALADFNFAQIFAENRYMGADRIADANQLTAAVTSRFIDTDTGVELLRGMLGQRYYFSDQRVALPGEPLRTSRDADLLAAVTGLVAPKTYVDTGWQYNPRDSRTERLNVMARYQPEVGKVMNAGYRYTRDLLDQIDISAQWPLGGGWAGIGRYNYSINESRVVESVAGFEYNAGCWAIRGVLQQLATTAESKTTSFFVQLELTGFSMIGSNPAEILRRTVPGYGRNYGTTDGDPAYY